MSKNERRFDLLVWGASGFTGRLVAEYLAANYGSNSELRWALAGRDADKLAAVKKSLGQSASKVDVVTGDSFDPAALNSMANQARVIVSTVGPYAKYGAGLVDACVKNGTHYCDLAGEAQWIRQMIDRHQSNAARSGARIVHCCGFDSVPMDVGVWFLQEEAQRRSGDYCKSIAMFLKASKGGPSGGTIASLINVIEEGRKNREIARILVDPYGLNPDGQRSGPDRRDQQNVRFDATSNSWTAPFVMAGINTKVVRRSHALLGFPYGKDFRYREAVMSGSGLKGRMRATAISLGLAGLVLGASFKPTRYLLQRFVLPKPGEGPDAATRETGFYDLRQFGELPDGSYIRSRISGDRDPGYGSTSKMLGECGVCLANDVLTSTGGIHTPVSAMARPLFERLRRNAGLTFEILD